MTAPVNRWVEADWAKRYLAERDDLPHRMEGFAVLLEVLPPQPRRVLDLGTGDGYTLGLLRSAVPTDEQEVPSSGEGAGFARPRSAGGVRERRAKRARPGEKEEVPSSGEGAGFARPRSAGGVRERRAKRARPERWIGVDFSAEMLGRARERFAGEDGVEIVEHDLDDPLPASLGRFDVVVSSFAIHHCVHERKRALYAEVFDLLEPGGMFANLEHVDSATPALHLAFLRAINYTPEQDDPSNKLLDVETQLQWLREIGFDDVDCLWKWREVALLCGVKPF